ncbi:MAG: hypothetical protein IEMM0008_0307 [bacterium]|nr:MAG: hypothetical protein IEMM0008_0307 [bacterium]
MILYFQRVQTPLQFWKVPGEEKHDESPLPSLPHEGGGEGKV